MMDGLDKIVLYTCALINATTTAIVTMALVIVWVGLLDKLVKQRSAPTVVLAMECAWKVHAVATKDTKALRVI